MKAKEFIPAEKPRNFVAKNAKMGGAGQHKDKKKSEKQGDFKHKKSLMPMETALRDKEDYYTKRKTLDDLGRNKDVDQKAVQQRRLDLDKEAKRKGIAEGDNSELERIQSDVWDFYKDVHNVRPRHWTQEQWNDENFLRLQMKQLSDIVNNMSPEEKAEQGWS
jgi:hypothetical protein